MRLISYRKDGTAGFDAVIASAAALKHAAGYACYNDATLRDWQRHTSQFTPSKNIVATGAFDPWLVTADELPDPAVYMKAGDSVEVEISDIGTLVNPVRDEQDPAA